MLKSPSFRLGYLSLSQIAKRLQSLKHSCEHLGGICPVATCFSCTGEIRLRQKNPDISPALSEMITAFNQLTILYLVHLRILLAFPGAITHWWLARGQLGVCLDPNLCFCWSAPQRIVPRLIQLQTQILEIHFVEFHEVLVNTFLQAVEISTKAQHWRVHLKAWSLKF